MEQLKQTRNVKSGFNAMGLPVPQNRLMNAYRAVQQMLPDIDKRTAFTIVSSALILYEGTNLLEL